jgi:Tol biopolymer transport system component
MRVLDITLISMTADGIQGNFGSYNAVFSPDGAKVAFESNANNLAGGSGGIFEKDLATGVVTRISTGNSHIDSDPVYLPNGTLAYTRQLIADNSIFLNNYDGFINDINAVGEVVWVLPGAADEEGELELPLGAVYSATGTKMAFSSNANLVGGDTNVAYDIFVQDLGSGVITRVSTSATGSEANQSSYDPVFSGDGTKVAFWSHASNLVAGDTNGNADMFVKDLTTGEVTLVSVTADGTQGNDTTFGKPSFSPDGTKIAFQSRSSNLITSDGNWSIDTFVKDLATGELSLVSTTRSGTQANSGCSTPVFSPDGTMLLFESGATNLVAGDTNRSSDIFLVTLGEGMLVRGTDDADKLRGGLSADVVTGFGGKDKLYGEGGADSFVFLTGDSGKSRTKADIIYDFTKKDSIDLSGWDADYNTEGMQAFNFIGSRALGQGQAGQLHFVKTKSDTWIEGNTDNDKQVEFVIHLDDAMKLTKGNFEGLL